VSEAFVPSRWPELFDHAMAIIDQVNRNGLGLSDWSFGGGTALMLQIDHRESHDIDLFLSDPQYLPYLSPEAQDVWLTPSPSSYVTDGRRHLKIVYDGIGEIDFICCAPLTQRPTEPAVINGWTVARELAAEIIAKKIVFRGASLQPRDLFDIAAASRFLGEGVLQNALTDFSAEARRALHVARAMDPDFAYSVISRLMIKPDYVGLESAARIGAIRVLEGIVAGANSSP